MTTFDTIWNNHLVYTGGKGGLHSRDGGPSLIYIDRHLIHEVTSPQAFEGLRVSGRKVRRPDLTFATMDHNVPTDSRSLPIIDEVSSTQIQTLVRNCREFGITLFDLASPDQGIVHIIGPQLGITLPGTTIVCGDSHTSTHGAFGAFAFGIGTSEVEHVLATQCLWIEKPKTFAINITGIRKNPHAITAKDIILSIIRKIGTAGATGTVIEYSGNVVSELSMEQRMTMCNMSIEAGARAGLITPDQKTFDYLKGRRYVPKEKEFEKMVEFWRQNLKRDKNPQFDKSVTIEVSTIAPQVTWGTNPSMAADVTETVPDPEEYSRGNESEMRAAARALQYMDLSPGIHITDIPIDRVFIGSCTNSRLEDLMEASIVVKGRKVSPKVRAMIVPGSQQVKMDAERLGLDIVFKDAGFEWREKGFNMCLRVDSRVLGIKEKIGRNLNR